MFDHRASARGTGSGGLRRSSRLVVGQKRDGRRYVLTDMVDPHVLRERMRAGVVSCQVCGTTETWDSAF
ncbi:hypothetical protein WK99_13805 [Burkholderia ubonensis]|nr:hypothetical protein WK99_13805 [Burkholderia ubonensis]